MNREEKVEYNKWYKEQEGLVKDFKFSVEDLHNLYDLFYMINWLDYKTLEINNMKKWFEGFFDRLESICLKELEKDEPA